jgi:hypothetical protein
VADRDAIELVDVTVLSLEKDWLEEYVREMEDSLVGLFLVILRLAESLTVYSSDMDGVADSVGESVFVGVCEADSDTDLLPLWSSENEFDVDCTLVFENFVMLMLMLEDSVTLADADVDAVGEAVNSWLNEARVVDSDGLDERVVSPVSEYV